MKEVDASEEDKAGAQNGDKSDADDGYDHGKIGDGDNRRFNWSIGLDWLLGSCFGTNVGLQPGADVEDDRALQSDEEADV